MKLETFAIQGLKVFELPVFSDSRGFFCERYKTSWEKEILGAEGFVQDNFSRSAPNVLRGLHFQHDPVQGKLITCLAGEIFDVAVDLRKGSATFGQYQIVELKGDKPKWFWVPGGFAHGFCVMGNQPADILYKVTSSYNPKGEAGILWNDPDLKIPWPIHSPILTDKDKLLPSFQAYKASPIF